MSSVEERIEVPESLHAYRLDQTIAKLLSAYSRARIQKWIQNGYVQINHTPITLTKHKVKAGDIINIHALIKSDDKQSAEAIALDIVYEDEDIIIMNKPAGLVVHPGAGNPNGTLVNALLYYDKNLDKLPRAGLIHRLDKDTTGLIISAKHLVAHSHLSGMMQRREIKRQYAALCQGTMVSGKTIDHPIDRDLRSRIKMAVVSTGKNAITHYRINERFRAHTLINVELETGRTHQIRVHMTHTGHPLVGDQTYKKQIALECKISDDLKTACKAFKRQALHAERLSFTNPISGTLIEASAPIPDDFNHLINAMRTDRDLTELL
jgi:23S rRNA pseudouridine1911/1915/1917 synthase